MVLASCIGVYFLIHEGIKEFTDFFCKKSWKKRGIVAQTGNESMPIIQNDNQCVKGEVKNENPPLTREDARLLLTEIFSVKAEAAFDNKEELVKSINRSLYVKGTLATVDKPLVKIPKSRQSHLDGSRRRRDGQ